MNEKNRKKYIIGSVLAIIIIVGICVIVNNKNNQRAFIGSGSSFKEIGFMSLDDTRKNNIKEVLTGMYVEKDDYAGFISHSSKEIDVKSTAFGSYLASQVGFEMNKSKINNYIQDNYNKIYSEKTTYDKAYDLYYNIMIDQSINGYRQNYNIEYFQNQIDEILYDVTYNTQTLAADVETTRRAMEIVKDLSIWGADMYITNKQKNKIERGMKKAIRDENISCSILLKDIHIVSDMLNFNIVTEEKIAETYEKLMVDGGFKKSEGSKEPDVNSTYWFTGILNGPWNVDYFDKEHKEKYGKFIDDLEIKEGIYTYDSKSEYIDLSVIAQGNSIYFIRLSGDKRDENK